MIFLALFWQFIVECHGNTLLPQFLGMYRLTVDGDETYMIVTRNVFSHHLSVYKKYDLKVGGEEGRTDQEKKGSRKRDQIGHQYENIFNKINSIVALRQSLVAPNFFKGSVFTDHLNFQCKTQNSINLKFFFLPKKH